MGDNLREPRKHTRMYDEMVLRVIGGDTTVSKVAGELNRIMRENSLSPQDLQRIMRFVCERHRWAEYAIRQEDAPKTRLFDDAKDDDEEEAV